MSVGIKPITRKSKIAHKGPWAGLALLRAARPLFER
jgi:hypothetical protein